jgi:hypothetical protein
VRGKGSGRGLTTKAGRTICTTTPCFCTSIANARFHVCSPPLVQEYVASSAEGIRPDMEPMLRMSDLDLLLRLEECAVSLGRTTRVSWRVPRMFCEVSLRVARMLL